MSVLCWATIRFSSAVMPVKRRMFWNVRATRALAAISKSGIRSSRKSAFSPYRLKRAPLRVSAATSSAAALPVWLMTMRPDVGL